MIDQTVANAITQYKIEERRTRALLANGLNILLQAKRERAALAAGVAASGIPELVEFYEYQLTVNDPPAQPGATVAALDAIETGIGRLHALIAGINAAAVAATGSPVFDNVPTIETITED